MSSTAEASPTQEQSEHEDLIKQYTLTEKLSSPPPTPYEGAGRLGVGSGRVRVGFVHGPTLPITRAGTRARVRLAIWGKVSAKSGKVS